MQVDRAYDGQIAERLLKRESYDCVIMDINLPKKNGYDLCREFRRFNDHTPVLMLTAFDELEDKIQGFDSGADDYLTKPFFMKELILRVKSLIKRSKNTSNKVNEQIIAGDITIDLDRKSVV